MKVKLLNPDAILPTKAHENDAEFDIYTPYDFVLRPVNLVGYTNVIETRIAIEVPDGKFSLIKERSSLALRGMVITAGVIDWGYRGEIKVICHNVSDTPIYFSAGAKIAQLIVLPYFGNVAEEVESVSRTLRGEGGFGSSGK